MNDVLIRHRVASVGAGLETPPFEPHPWLRGGHVQTIVGRYLPGQNHWLESTFHEIDLKDGDRLGVLESIPAVWRNGDPAVVLVHGLASCAEAPYMLRVARRLLTLGVRVVRMNLRGAGAGFGLARNIYHAGRSDDVRCVVDWLVARVSGSSIAVGGFSLGAALTLKLAAEAAEKPLEGLDCIFAANPPIDLLGCARRMRERENRIYDWSFVRWLRSEVARLHRRFPDLGPTELDGIRSVYEFDDRYTAPRNGFASADDYYVRSSTETLIPRIRCSGFVVHAADDPFIPVDPFLRIAFPSQLTVELTRHGGHLGYLSRSRWNGDRRWLDVRLASWLAARWHLRTSDRTMLSSTPAADHDRRQQGARDPHA